jgi:glutaredoxin
MTAKIEIFTSPTCPYCPGAVKAAREFAKGNDVQVVENSTATMQGSKRAEEYDVRSVPTLVITGPGSSERIGYVGIPSQSGLKKMVNIALGKEGWEEPEGLLSKIKKKLGG